MDVHFCIGMYHNNHFSRPRTNSTMDILPQGYRYNEFFPVCGREGCNHECVYCPRIYSCESTRLSYAERAKMMPQSQGHS